MDDNNHFMKLWNAVDIKKEKRIDFNCFVEFMMSTRLSKFKAVHTGKYLE
jgi:hypothetical protein